MNFDRHSSVAEQAKALLRNASSGFGIKALLEKTDNYNLVWARDSAVSGLAALCVAIIKPKEYEAQTKHLELTPQL